MRGFWIALATACVALGLASLWRPASETLDAAVSRDAAPALAAPAGDLPDEPRAPPVDFGGSFGSSDGDLTREEGLTHLALGAKFLEFGDYYSALSHLASARAGLGDRPRLCSLLAVAYDQLNMTLDLIEIMPCLARAALESERASRLYDRLSRQTDVEASFQAAASDHFVASFPAGGSSADDIGLLLDILEDAHDRVETALGLASVRIVPVVIYEGDQFESATDKPHWALGIYDGKIRVSSDSFDEQPEFFETALTHEYVHALTHEYTGTRLPTWFREGMADHLARTGTAAERALPDPRRESRRILGFDEINREFVSLSRESALLAYRQSYWMVRDLVTEAGWDAVGDLIRDLQRHHQLGFTEAFEDLYGESPARFFDRWITAR
ncbi:MAG: hypothetical protein ACE5FL_02540 [Myxococcota bacterium]